ncbi:zf-RING_2 domain-containing protein [Cephalotus follicularis]|uniref:RING-type E3 ubiquitin transferase n=1 Tax=Cephalotus follicularis TaxID=3775 RepID=A0A1Q3CU84_CEPFO|nr:zf-RING_2 domain-containing protein [Cephalotus follicularis]
MQGQRSAIDSFPETVDLDQGSVSNNTGMRQHASLNDMLNPVESRLSNYPVSSSEATCANAVTHNVQSFSGWSSGESSSRLNLQNQVNDDGIKMDHDWSSSFSARPVAGSSSEERLFEPNNILFSGRGLSQARSGPLFLRGSSSNHISQNVNMYAGFMGNRVNGGQEMAAGADPNLSNLGRLETEHMPPATACSNNVGTSSGSAGHIVDENNGNPGSSLGCWGLSCKRKALEGTSGLSNPDGSSGSFPQAENGALSGPARNNTSSSLGSSTASWISPSNSLPEQLSPSIEVGMRGLVPDSFPSSSVTGNAESSLGHFGRSGNSGHHQEYVPFNVSSTGSRQSTVWSSHQSPIPVPFSDSPDLSPTAALAANLITAQNHSHAMPVSSMSRNVHTFPWNGASNSRYGSASNSLISGERGAALREETNLRSIPRNNTEHPMFVPAIETRNMAQDPASWSLATGNMSTSGAMSSTTRIGPSSSIRPLPSPTWLPHANPSPHNEQRPWSLFPSVETGGGHSGHFPPLSSGPSASSQGSMTLSAFSSQGHQQPYARSAFLMERLGDDLHGNPRSFRAMAADVEERQRLISEIRQVLNDMRRGENIRVEDYMLFDLFVYNRPEVHDRHRDLRLDVDNMSYEELLALEERIGDVSTGLSEETILKLMKQRKYTSIIKESSADQEPCCICQEEYGDGDDVGMLDCGHDFHTNCIRQWLLQKNLCPICKTTALLT